MKAVFVIIILFFSIIPGKSNEIVKLATVDFPPYSFLEKDEIKGIEVEIIERIFEKLGIKYTIELLPFARALKSVEDGDRDFIFNFYKNPDRLKKFDYSDPILDNPLIIFTKKDRDIVFTGKIDELRKYNIGTMIGYTYSPEFDKARNEKLLKTEEVCGHEQNFKKLVSGRIDIYIVERSVGLYLTKKLGIQKQVKHLNIPLKKQNGYIGISKKNPKKVLLTKINESLKAMKASGEYQNIFDKYLK